MNRAVYDVAPVELRSWERVRRYAVPRRVIERATERRLAGDWRGACAAADVAVDFTLDGIARGHGRAFAEALEDDLLNLAPDLLRWHFPRILHGRSTMATGRTVDLTAGGPVLRVVGPRIPDGPQGLRLVVARAHAAPPDDGLHEDWSELRFLWDARRAGDALAFYGDGTRMPFFHPDGTPLTPAELPSSAPSPTDAVRFAEWAAAPGGLAAALDAAGIKVRDVSLEQVARRFPHVPLLAAAIRRRGRAMLLDDWRPVLAETGDDGTPSIVRSDDYLGDKTPPPLPGPLWTLPPDLMLLRAGLLTPDELHPLVRSACFPARGPADGPVGPPDPPRPVPVRVRCGSAWHEMRPADGGFAMPHTADEQRRERAMRAFGGAVTGCFEIHERWRTGRGRLPKGLRAQRADLFLRAQHGDADGVLDLLDHGVDPHVRDARRRTLLHLLPCLDHARLLPRLLDLGADLEARDHVGRTPLAVAVAELGSTDLVAALLAAGARIDPVDDEEGSLADLIDRWHRTDLLDLRARVAAEHPDVIAGYWSERD
ncbi:ankyrin repeat domain-containing protein [Actinomadura rayongensis]|uniref:Ankyrin repeat domain-containing protein n=1 Tax=Actinomadura rayongensis TaxID=1429076 RepID=A0A6I4WHW3_9ACTN|nr:ankyrin repeat domain-containing protein [Actinomadura rayongensis]MXQ67925.1 ankyrin repeat domain-containing protein [Actinomadura rayongensis]